jgi:hypothetical protein
MAWLGLELVSDFLVENGSRFWFAAVIINDTLH